MPENVILSRLLFLFKHNISYICNPEEILLFRKIEL